MNKEDVKPGRYRHYKGREYQVVGIAKHSETLENYVIYKALYGAGQLWIRPLKMFREQITVDGREIPRFEYLGDIEL